VTFQTIFHKPLTFLIPVIHTPCTNFLSFLHSVSLR